MWQKLVIGVITFKIMCSVVNASNSNSIPSLPYCPSKNGSGALLVSTLDGKLSAINSTGHLSWEIETGPGPLLISNIHKLELTNNGEWIRIIPSLTGTLYKFDGSTIDPISISAESLLRSSFRYSDDLVIAGGIEVRTYGVGFNSGKVLYECTQSRCSNHQKEEMDDVVVVERSTQTIRAVEPRTGHERWNFSVGLHNIKLPQVSCIDTKVFDSNISAIIPEGLLFVSSIKENMEESTWQYKFHSPIVRVWKWDGSNLNEVNLFEPKNMPGLIVPANVLPSIYIGMHKKQLYIHESIQMQALLHGGHHIEFVPAESNSITKIPWKPVSASAQSTEDDSTAISVLNNSEYVNGNGYYLYTEHDLKEKNRAHCDKNQSSTIDPVIVEEEALYSGLFSFFSGYGRYYKEFFFMVISIVLIRFWNKISPKNQEIIIVEKPVDAEITRMERQISEKSSEGFSSRFMDDFKLIQCLGKGGFGVVFQVKHRHDDCDYAIKRITLPNKEKSRTRVMREVKALAKLEHKNIIRYFSSWVEHPPLGWEQEHDKDWIEPSLSEKTTLSETTSRQKRIKSLSVSIDIPLATANDPSFETDKDSEISDDSFVVFENDESPNNPGNDSFIVFESSKSVEGHTNMGQSIGNETIIAKEALDMTAHLKKKIDWKRPGRKHHSWDLTQSSSAPVIPVEPPRYLYIQMQLCQKESLKEWLNLHQKREYVDVLQIFLQILDAVEYVHLLKLIHRDLKPSNIFFSLDGQIKVGDFGLVKDIESAIDLDYSRRPGSTSTKGHTKDVGTTLYMSPEQSKGYIYDYKVDIYSLGIILFELLVPFSTAMERFKTLTDVKSRKFPEGFAEKYPAEHSLLLNMLDDDPSKRLTTIGIRARDPLATNNINSYLSDDQHFSLKNFHSH
ncbi:eukaryotic translation initiation factor 2-alpha kinase [Euwallacea fornicatus]|uniref:eukaryotic translation initiation factor 2-alpha kinase n=1 Tax=Euwallacea fornicatus TaxID=995702 RepID=UPI00338F6F78